jgi:hypothetical protein
MLAIDASSIYIGLDMGIEFIDNEITSEQVIIPRHMRASELQGLTDGQTAFIPDWCIWMDTENRLWIDVLAPTSDGLDEVSVNDYLCVMKLPEGIVVDITTAIDTFTDEDSGEISFQPQDSPEYGTEGYSLSRIPVIGLLVNDGEVELFRELVRGKYNYTYPITEVSPGS